MKLLYPSPKLTQFALSFIKVTLTVIMLIAMGYTVANAQTTSQELVFKNPVLVSGKAGENNAVYRFASVMAGTDALITINDRSSSMVSLVNLDLTSSGYNNAFQPQVTYGNNSSPAGNTDWWMEFQVTFVLAGTKIPANMLDFSLTGLDIDGNNDKISEYAGFYGMLSFTLENTTSLTASVIEEKVKGKMTSVGERFDGTVKNYTNVDTIATTAMVTNTYVATNSFRLRTGAKSTGISGAADRMYSFWFKTFNYQQSVISFLPVTLINWNAAYTNSAVALKWTTTMEKNASHFIVERSFDGAEYSDIAMLFAVGNSDISNNYAFNDKVSAGNSGIIYYRLKMVDMDGQSKTSDIRIVRLGKSADVVKVIAYPNPVVSDVRITIPAAWQGKQVNYQLSNAGGQIIKSYTVQYASQTEVINMTQVPTGMYIIHVINGSETAVQSVVKSAR